MACDMAITEATARRIYDGFLSSQGRDGCTLDEVATENAQMTVVWKTHGAALPAAAIQHTSCAPADAIVGPTLAIHVPESLRTACPATVQAAVAMIQHESFDMSVGGTRPARGWQPIALGGIALATLAFIVTMVLRHRPTGGR
jgi:hypothetical protein